MIVPCVCVCFVHSWIFRFSGYKDKKETYKDDDDYEDQDEQNENDNDENDEQVAAKVS